MDIDFLTEAYHRVRKDGAAGLSGVTSKDYRLNLTENLTELHQRLKNQTYVAPKIKRVWIDKDGGKKRPIGITEFEDKIVQKRWRCYWEPCTSKTFTTSFHTMSKAGTQAKDTFMTISQTAKKLDVRTYEYIRDRVSGEFKLPSLAQLIHEKSLACGV